MDWNIVWRKLWRGTLVAGWVAFFAPLALHCLGVAKNVLKHWGDAKL